MLETKTDNMSITTIFKVLYNDLLISSFIIDSSYI